MSCFVSLVEQRAYPYAFRCPAGYCGTDESVPYLHERDLFVILGAVMHMALPNRKLPRLKDYDYSTPGAYFVTICTYEKRCLFGRIMPATDSTEAYMRYSPMGEIARECLLDLASHYDNLKVDNWVIMPNHIHMLIQITERVNPFPTVRCDIPNVVGKYKAAVTRKAGKVRIPAGKLWQSS